QSERVVGMAGQTHEPNSMRDDLIRGIFNTSYTLARHDANIPMCCEGPRHKLCGGRIKEPVRFSGVTDGPELTPGNPARTVGQTSSNCRPPARPVPNCADGTAA